MRPRDAYCSAFLQAADGVNFATCPEDTSEGYVKKKFNLVYFKLIFL